MHQAGAHLAGGHSLLCQVGSFGNLLGEHSVQAKFPRKAHAPGPERLPQGRHNTSGGIIKTLCP